MRKLLIMAGVLLLPIAARSQVLTNAQAVKPVVPYSAVQANIVPSTGTVIDATAGNSTTPTTSANVFGTYIENMSTTATLYVCYNNSSCSASAGANQGIPIPARTATTKSAQYFSTPTWEKVYLVSDTVAERAIIVRFK